MTIDEEGTLTLSYDETWLTLQALRSAAAHNRPSGFSARVDALADEIEAGFPGPPEETS